MNRLALLLLIIAVSITQAQEPSNPSWSRYTVKDEEFSVLLQTLPAMTTTEGTPPESASGERVYAGKDAIGV